MALEATALPVTVMSFVDPLVGVLPLLAAIIVTVIARFVSRVPLPRLELIGIIAAVSVAAATLIVLAITSDGASASSDQVENSLGTWGTVLLWVYRAAVVLALAGAVQYLVRLVRALLPVPMPRAARR